ncbi:putative baseplate assembly protein [Geodermatophilus obscurus]|uniref:Putative baseplate assembly protein n=1 Tax=Geodermatophilus obscurus TaxID=1861 RepID=A0A1M7S3U4_9ACTN|nr:baseplate J/gp47 family protein [Geodermatophilus obscurus]SHN52962.1 putative baseplate assembly protein [Geodermatophilus obscurus]
MRSHAEFLAAMLREVDRRQELRRLTTREDGDPSIALLDAWAAVLDVLTFYSERILQEGFLRTATEPRSVVELARAIAYEPRPGVAAQALLTFDLETAPGAPERVVVPVGTKVASLPGPGERPQLFETVAELVARPSWSRMPARRDVDAVPAGGLRALYVTSDERLLPGDRLLLVHRDATGAEGFAARTVAEVERLGDRARVSWTDPVRDRILSVASVGPAVPEVTAHTLAVARPFGHNAPDPASLPPQVARRFGGTGADRDWAELTLSLAGWRQGRVAAGVEDLVVGDVAVRPALQQRIGEIAARPTPVRPPERPGPILGGFAAARPRRGFANSELHLDGDEHDVAAGRPLILTAGPDQRVFRVVSTVPGFLTDFTLTRPVLRVQLDGSREEFTDRLRATTALLASAPLRLAPAPRTTPHEGRDVPLVAPVPPPPPGRRVAVTGRRAQVTTTRKLTLKLAGGRSIVVAAGARLTARAWPRVTGRAAVWSLQDSSGRTGTATVLRGTVHWILAAEDAPTTAAVLTAADPGGEVDRTAVVSLGDDLPVPIDPATLVLDANVVPATHGETTAEVLGTSHPETPDQHFRLGDGPVTHVLQAEGSGARSTLVVRVGGVVWDEVPTLYGLPGDARVHVTRQDDDGQWSVRFGDGAAGAQPPGGAEISAAYRVGLGRAGNVAAGALSQLRTRPLGVRGVTNPLPAEGGDDAETIESARRNAPLYVRTLDRVVSVRDHEDHAATFNGVGRATARELWDGRRRIVHLTCTGPAGTPLAESTRTALAAALRSAGDGLQPVTVQGHDDRQVVLRARVFADRQHRPDTVGTDCLAALLAAFAAPARSLAQAMTVGDVARTLHQVAGVRGVDLLELRLTTDLPGTVLATVPAAPARVEAGAVRPAQLVALSGDEPPVLTVEVEE